MLLKTWIFEHYLPTSALPSRPMPTSTPSMQLNAAISANDGLQRTHMNAKKAIHGPRFPCAPCHPAIKRYIYAASRRPVNPAKISHSPPMLSSAFSSQNHSHACYRV